MNPIFFLFLAFTSLYAVKVQIFFPNCPPVSFGTLQPNENPKCIFSSLNPNEIASQTPSGSVTLRDLAESIKRNGIYIYLIPNENFDYYLENSFFYREKPNAKMFLFKFPNSTLIKDILVERHPSSFTLGVNHLLRFQAEITSIEQVNAFVSDEFTMTIEQYEEQDKIVPMEKVGQNLKEIAAILEYYRQKSPIFNGNQTVNLRRVIVVCEDPSTGELTFKIIVPAFLGMNIHKLLDDFHDWSRIIILKNDLMAEMFLGPIENCVNYYEDGLEKKSYSSKAAIYLQDDERIVEGVCTTETIDNGVNCNHAVEQKNRPTKSIDSVDCDQEVERIMTNGPVICQDKRKHSQIDENYLRYVESRIKMCDFESILGTENTSPGEKDDIFKITCELVESCKKIGPLQIDFKKLREYTMGNFGAKKAKRVNLPA